MTEKIYKTAQGKIIDLGRLMLENENTRAVGNMNVNARGDVLDHANKVIDPKVKRVQRHYSKQTNVTSTPVIEGTKQVKARAEAVDKDSEPDPMEFEDLYTPVDEHVGDNQEAGQETSKAAPVPRGGLAAAIARSREVKQELMKTPRQQAQTRPGVKKI